MQTFTDKFEYARFFDDNCYVADHTICFEERFSNSFNFMIRLTEYVLSKSLCNLHTEKMIEAYMSNSYFIDILDAAKCGFEEAFPDNKCTDVYKYRKEKLFSTIDNVCATIMKVNREALLDLNSLQGKYFSIDLESGKFVLYTDFIKLRNELQDKITQDLFCNLTKPESVIKEMNNALSMSLYSFHSKYS